MATSRPYAALNFQGYLILWYRIIKPPFTYRVEFVLLDTLNVQVCMAYNCENVPYLWLFRRISAFLCLYVTLLIHKNKF